MRARSDGDSLVAMVKVVTFMLALCIVAGFVALCELIYQVSSGVGRWLRRMAQASKGTAESGPTQRVTPLPPLDPARVRQMCREMCAENPEMEPLMREALARPMREPGLFVEGDSDTAVIQSVIDLSRRL